MRPRPRSRTLQAAGRRDPTVPLSRVVRHGCAHPTPRGRGADVLGSLPRSPPGARGPVPVLWVRALDAAAMLAPWEATARLGASVVARSLLVKTRTPLPAGRRLSLSQSTLECPVVGVSPPRQGALGGRLGATHGPSDGRREQTIRRNQGVLEYLSEARHEPCPWCSAVPRLFRPTGGSPGAEEGGSGPREAGCRKFSEGLTAHTPPGHLNARALRRRPLWAGLVWASRPGRR